MAEKSLKINAFYSVLRVFLSLIFPLITFPYASRILLPEGIGKVNFANSIISYFIIIASLGIGGYTTREAAKLKGNKQGLTKLFKEIITINLICCIIAYIVFIMTLYTVPKFFLYRQLLLVCSIKIFFSVLGIEWIFTANEEFKYITLRTFIFQSLSLVYLFTFVKTENDLIHYTIFGIITSVGSNLFNIFYVFKYLDFTYHPKLDLKKHIKPIFIFFGISIVTSIYTMLDTTMLGFLSNDTEVGFYTASTKLGHMILSMLTALTTVLLPRLTHLIKTNDESTFKILVNKSANILILLSLPMTCGLIILCKPLIVLLSGENYLPAVTSMIVISPIIIFISFGSLTGVQILPSLGKEKISFYSYIFGAITNLTINTIFIPKIGALGAAIGTVCAEFIVTFIQIIYLRKLIFSKKFFLNLLQSIVACIFMVISIQILITFINNITIQLFVCTIIGIIVYSVFLIILKNECFLFYFNKLFNKLLNK